MFEMTAATDRLYDAADRLTEARESIKERLLRGKAIGRKTLDGAFEVAVGEQMKEREIIAILCNLACAENEDERIECQRRTLQLVDSYVTAMASEVEDEAARIHRDRMADDYDYAQAARHCGAV